MGHGIDPPGLQRPARHLHGPVLPGYYQEFLLPAVHSAAVRIASSLHYPSWRSAPGRTISCGKREVSSTRSVTLHTQRCTPPEPWVVMAIASHPPNSSSPSSSTPFSSMLTI